MDVNLIIVLVFGMCTGVLSQDGCKLADQPFIDDYELERSMGRWYLVYMAPGRNEQGEGSVIDIYHENGKFYVRNVYLSPSGECLPSTDMEIRRQKNVDYFTLYAEGQRVADFRSFGGDFIHYGLYHFCTTVKEGVCVDPYVQIWSRTKQLPNNLLKEAKEETKKICLQPHTYDYESGKYEKCPGPESSREICQLRYIPYVRYLDTEKGLGIWYLAGWYNHLGGDPPADLKGSVINIQQRHGVLYYELYFASENGCKKLGSITLTKTSPGGQVRQYGVSHNGSETHIAYIDYNRYLVSWICTKMDNGVCTESAVRVWSRTPTLPEAEMNEARAYKKLLCKPEREMTYGGSPHGVCKHVSSSATKTAVLAPGRIALVVVGAIFWILQEQM